MIVCCSRCLRRRFHQSKVRAWFDLAVRTWSSRAIGSAAPLCCALEARLTFLFESPGKCWVYPNGISRLPHLRVPRGRNLERTGTFDPEQDQVDMDAQDQPPSTPSPRRGRPLKNGHQARVKCDTCRRRGVRVRTPIHVHSQSSILNLPFSVVPREIRQ